MAEGKDWPQPSGGDGDARCRRAREGQSRFPPGPEHPQRSGEGRGTPRCPGRLGVLGGARKGLGMGSALQGGILHP